MFPLFLSLLRLLRTFLYIENMRRGYSGSTYVRVRRRRGASRCIVCGDIYAYFLAVVAPYSGRGQVDRVRLGVRSLHACAQFWGQSYAHRRRHALCLSQTTHAIGMGIGQIKQKKNKNKTGHNSFFTT